jgi:hypothetical protein
MMYEDLDLSRASVMVRVVAMLLQKSQVELWDTEAI